MFERQSLAGLPGTIRKPYPRIRRYGVGTRTCQNLAAGDDWERRMLGTAVKLQC